MPIYEYKCEQCNVNFETIYLSKNTTLPIICPNCKSKDITKLISVSFVRPSGIPKGKGGFAPPVCKSTG